MARRDEELQLRAWIDYPYTWERIAALEYDNQLDYWLNVGRLGSVNDLIKNGRTEDGNAHSPSPEPRGSSSKVDSMRSPQVPVTVPCPWCPGHVILYLQLARHNDGSLTVESWSGRNQSCPHVPHSPKPSQPLATKEQPLAEFRKTFGLPTTTRA